MFKKVCLVLFLVGLVLAVGLAWLGAFRVAIGVLALAALVQAVGRVR